MDSRSTPNQALTIREAARSTISQCLLDLGIIAKRLEDQGSTPLPQAARQLDVLADEVRQAGEWLGRAAGGDQGFHRNRIAEKRDHGAEIGQGIEPGQGLGPVR